MTPGYRTTEFWLTLGAMLVGALLASGLLPTGGLAAQIIGAVGVFLAKLGYTTSRTLVKRSDAANGDASAPIVTMAGKLTPDGREIV